MEDDLGDSHKMVADIANQYKRRNTAIPDMSFFTPSSVGFRPRPYNPQNSQSSGRSTSTSSETVAVQKVEIQVAPPKPHDPDPDDPSVLLLHPPFNNFPGAHNNPEGLTYSVLAENPEWFLDPLDFKGENDSNPDAIVYPQCLEPPRGWCPTKKKDVKQKSGDAWTDDDAPKLRCTFCRRKYAGVNAKSMWRRHVLEKHKIPMANRREGPVESSRMRRSANKENTGLTRRFSSQDLERMQRYCDETQQNGASSSRLSQDSADEWTPPIPPMSIPIHMPYPNMAAQRGREQARVSAGDESFSSVETRSPETPGSPTEEDSLVIPSSPPVYLGLLNGRSTPPLRSSSPSQLSQTPGFQSQLDRRVPLKYMDPEHPLYSSPDELMVGIAVQGMTGEGLKAEYVPASESPFFRKSPSKNQIQASPLSCKVVNGRVYGWTRADSSARSNLSEISTPPPTKLQLSYSGPLPVPLTDLGPTKDVTEADAEFVASSSSNLFNLPEESLEKWIDMSQLESPVRSSSINAPSSNPASPSGSANKRSLWQMQMQSTQSWPLLDIGIGLGITMPSESLRRPQPSGFSSLLPPAEVFGPVNFPTSQETNSSETSFDDSVRRMLADLSPPMKRRRTFA